MNFLELTEKILSEDVLNERLSSTVYHATKLENVIKALGVNSIKLAACRTSKAKIPPNITVRNPYYLSLSRTINNGFFRTNFLYKNLVAIELDGDKLSDNFKGKAINKYGALSNRSNYSYTDESEDRLFSKKKEIPNFRKYIKAIHTMDSETVTVSGERGKFKQGLGKKLNELKKSAKGIPIYVYSDWKDYRILNKSKARKL